MRGISSTTEIVASYKGWPLARVARYRRTTVLLARLVRRKHPELVIISVLMAVMFENICKILLFGDNKRLRRLISRD